MDLGKKYDMREKVADTFGFLRDLNKHMATQQRYDSQMPNTNFDSI